MNSTSYMCFGIFCIIIDIWIIYKTRVSIRYNKEDASFIHISGACGLFFLFDLLSARLVGVPVGPYCIGNRLFTAFYYINAIYVGYIWYKYILKIFQNYFLDKLWFRIMIKIPLFVGAIVVLLSTKTGWVFLIDEFGGFNRGPIHIWLIILAYMYILAASILCLGRFFDEEYEGDRERLLVCSRFVVIPVIGGIIQLINNQDAPFLCAALVLALLAVFVDNQERKVAGSSQMLFEQQKRINLALKEAMDTSNQADVMKKEFMAKISHTIRTQINGIAGLVSMAKDNIANEKMLEDYLHKIEDESGKIVKIVNDMLDTDVAGLKNDEVADEIFDMRAVLKKCVETVKAQFEDKNIAFMDFFPKFEHYILIGSETNFSQIILNILDNAFRYNVDNGKVVFAAIETGITDNKANFKFVISDTGVGIEPEALKHIFIAFSNDSIEDNEYTDNKNYALGMPLVRTLVERMDGEIQVESEVGVGTQFVLNLSFEIAKVDEKKESESVLSTVENRLEGMKILIADDDDINLEVAQYIVKKAGAECTIVKDGDIALDVFTKSEVGEYSAILMDIEMPNMNGYMATKAIRELPRYDAKEITIIAVSANTHEENIENAKEAGMNDYVVKPLSLEHLINALEKYK